MPRSGHFIPRIDPVPTLRVAEWSPGPDWTGKENPASNGIRSTDRQPVASHYTGYAIPARRACKLLEYYFLTDLIG